jgi:two-component system, NarL family, nitrate/nitrite response regulator NarL
VSPRAGTFVRFAVVGDDPLARAGLVALLASEPALALVGQGTPADAARLVAQADVVLWDAGPGSLGGGLEDGPGVVVALVADERQAVLALAAGARGVLPRDVSARRLAAAIAAANAGLVVVDESLGEVLGRREGAPASLPEPLTPRELEVLALLGQGLSNKAISARLGISESTAKFHVNSILGKLGVASRSEAIVHASRLGLLIL